MLEKGLVQIYTGEGKGKTTAAFGLSIRAAGHGAKVLIFQFLKPDNLDLGERGLLRDHIDNIHMRWLDEPWDMFRSMGDEQEMARVKQSATKVLKELQTAAHEKYYDVMILDEIVFCVSQGLVPFEEVKALVELADQVTEMKMIKHP